MKHLKLLLLYLSLSLVHSSIVGAFQANVSDTEWMRLGTLWEAPGWIEEISSTGEFVIAGERNQIRKLIRIETGEVLFEQEKGNLILSPAGDHAVRYGLENRSPYRSTVFELLDLNTLQIRSFDGFFEKFSPDGRYIVMSEDEEGSSGFLLEAKTTIIETTTGKEIADFVGDVSRFSRDVSLVSVVRSRLHDDTVYVDIIEIATNSQIAEFSHPIPETTWSVNSVFNADDSLMALYFIPEEMQIISTDTWEVLYTLPGAISFSPDGRYIASNNHAGYSDVQLVEAHTGRVLDEFTGSLSFSEDGQYWIRGEAIDYDSGDWDWRIIDLSTQTIVFQRRNNWGMPHLHENSVVQIRNGGEMSTQFIDLRTDEIIREVNGWVEWWGDLIIVERDTGTPFSYLQNWHTPETYAIGQQIKMTPDGKYALVSNGLFVDVYGAPGSESSAMPPARPDEGIARIQPGEIVIYPEPDAENRRTITENNMLNATYMYVLGRAETPGWLFVLFLSWGQNSEWIQGWIRSDKLETIVSWETVPVLDAADPIANLQSIAFGSD